MNRTPPGNLIYIKQGSNKKESDVLKKKEELFY